MTDRTPSRKKYETDENGNLWFCDCCFFASEQTAGSRTTIVQHLEEEHGITTAVEYEMTVREEYDSSKIP